jgi:SAM-dependent methyltransferase
LVDYYDIPHSRTFEYAAKRFKYYGILGKHLNIITEYNELFKKKYDVVMTHEMLEHHPDARKAIGDIAKLLKTGGIALVTEAFGAIGERWQTHLKSNLRYRGKTVFLFLKNDLLLIWYCANPLFKPIEFTKKDIGSAYKLLYRIALLRDKKLLRELLAGYWQRGKRILWNVMP